MGGRVKIFFGKWKRGEKDGHIGALRRGGKGVLTATRGTRERKGQTQRNQREAEGKTGNRRRG